MCGDGMIRMIERLEERLKLMATFCNLRLKTGDLKHVLPAGRQAGWNLR